MRHHFAALLLATNTHFGPGGSGLQVRPLQYQSRAEDSPACAFRLATSSELRTDVFKWAIGDAAWLNVGGPDVKVQVVREQNFPLRKHENSVGDRSINEFKGGGLGVVLETKITKVCPKDNPYCESWYEEGTLSVTKGTTTVKVQVKGACISG